MYRAWGPPQHARWARGLQDLRGLLFGGVAVLDRPDGPRCTRGAAGALPHRQLVVSGDSGPPVCGTWRSAAPTPVADLRRPLRPLVSLPHCAGTARASTAACTNGSRHPTSWPPCSRSRTASPRFWRRWAPWRRISRCGRTMGAGCTRRTPPSTRLARACRRAASCGTTCFRCGPIMLLRPTMVLLTSPASHAALLGGHLCGTFTRWRSPLPPIAGQQGLEPRHDQAGPRR